MTNEEAINILRGQQNAYWDTLSEEEHKVYDKAVEALEAAEWRSVKDKPPEHGKKYLIYATPGDSKVGHMTTATFGGHFVLTGRRAYWKVTHWMPMPEEPKE